MPHLVSRGAPPPPWVYPDDVRPRRQLVGIAGVELSVELGRLEHLEAGEEAQQSELLRDEVAGALPEFLVGRIAPGNRVVMSPPSTGFRIIIRLKIRV